jgi:CDP-6-deoxy-D-xylo-4-hexulose-3-dehydrase
MLQSSKGNIKNKVLYAKAVFGWREKFAVLKSMDNGWLASGPLVTQFEEKIAPLFGKKYGIAVNSGSSANLLALASLKLPQGSEVITPACTFSTTVSSILLNNLVPVFVDSVVGRYTIDEAQVKKAIHVNTKAILVPQLIGGVCDMVELKRIAKKFNLYLIDDSCDTLAPQLYDYPAAIHSDLTTTSFYGSHIITAMGFGGMVMTDSRMLKEQIVTMRDWGRVGNDREDFNARFNFSIDKIPYDAKFLYSELGFNLKMNEAAAAFGLEQLKRLPEFLKKRDENFMYLRYFFSQYKDQFYVPELIDGAKTNWLAFPLTIRANAKFNRYQLLQFFESKGIQTRVIFSGNITRHPVLKNYKFKVVGSLKNADLIMANGFLIGCHQGMGVSEVNYIMDSFKEFYDSVNG